MGLDFVIRIWHAEKCFQGILIRASNVSSFIKNIGIDIHESTMVLGIFVNKL